MVSSITPDLSGELEKLARLKESLNKIVQGRDVENASLGDFIFDASKAGGIKDFEESIRLEEQETSKHILNGKINKNQPAEDSNSKKHCWPLISPLSKDLRNWKIYCHRRIDLAAYKKIS